MEYTCLVWVELYGYQEQKLNERERFVKTLTFGQPDKVPLQPGGPRESTLRAWRRQGLPEEGNWHTHLMEILGIE